MSSPHRGDVCIAVRGTGQRWGALLLLPAILGTSAGCSLLRDQRDTYHLAHPVPVSDSAIRDSLGVLGAPLLDGNRVELLNNGDQIFPAMLRAIAGARMSVNLETYIFKADHAGQLLGDALAGAARRGVEVRLLVDGTSDLPRPFRERLAAAGVDLRFYHPIRLWTLQKVGRRTHRKILVVDGAVCFTGGAGIADEWLGDARNPREWREVQVQAAGPVAAEMQTTFSEDWTYTTGEILSGARFYPRLDAAGEMAAQTIKMSRGDSSSHSKMLYYLAIAAAERSVHIQNAYFLPDQQLRRELIAAAHRGVDVRIMVPGRHNDVPPVRMASRHHYGELLQGGVKIYEYTATMLHSKTAVIDGLLATVGSTNLDALSMKENAEENLVVYDRGFAALLEETFAQDLKRCREVTYESWRRRGLEQKLSELLSWFWEPLY